MAAKRLIKKTSIFSKFRDKYHLKILNDTTFEEVVSFRLSRMNVFVVVGLSAIILITAVTILIAFTPLREFIPGYPDGNMRKKIIRNSFKTDSLEYEIHLRDQFLTNLKNILDGKKIKSIDQKEDTTKKYDNIKFTKSKDDSMLRKRVESEDALNISSSENAGSGNTLSGIHFFTPLKGLITAKFDLVKNHYGTDIVAAQNSVITSVLDGTVIDATWTIDFGYIIQVQHRNNLISVYKHNSELLKSIGSHVTAGEPIAIIGNTGELSTGPHLHFELWYNGAPLNPEKYIIF
ncbi:MAG: M23 family metallopeptidase [Bacteroidia bacterium]|nr:M23 family metallopeptidase [Bacteroidia bacterium]